MILSAAIVDKDGTIFVARQYFEMSKAKVEAYYIAFSRLITKGKQHTIIETNDVRYIYQAINDFYCVLITDKHSNILEDIKTLRLFISAINQYASVGKGLVDEESILQNRFDLLFAFDEIVSLGVRQIDDLVKLKKVMEMKSEEEKAFMEALTKKEKEAKAKLAEKAKELDQQRRSEMLAQQAERMSRTNAMSSSLSSAATITTRIEDPEPVIETKPYRPSTKGRALKLRRKN